MTKLNQRVRADLQVLFTEGSFCRVRLTIVEISTAHREADKGSEIKQTIDRLTTGLF